MALAGKWGLLKFTFGTLGNETEAESTLRMKNILTYFVYNFQKTATISSLHREALKEYEKKTYKKGILEAKLEFPCRMVARRNKLRLFSETRQL